MIEENIIGLCVKGELDPLDTGLHEDEFLTLHHRTIWSALKEIRLNKMSCDVISATELLSSKTNSYDWFTILKNMADNVVSAYSAPTHIKKIKEAWRVSKLRAIGDQIVNSDKPDVNYFIKQLMELNSADQKYLYSFAEAGKDAVDELDAVMNGDIKTISTGLEDIDNVMGGLHNSDLIIVAARPAMGKTAFLFNMAAANQDHPLVFSTEQGRIQAAQRMFSIHGSVPGHKLRTGDIGDIEFAQIAEALNKLNDGTGYIYDKSGPYMSEIEAVSRKMKAEGKCSAIYLDYLQRIKHENQSLPKHEQVGDVAMRLKELARELNVPVIALAQVSRKCEDRTDKRPQMGDIKDSGTVEQEADSILTLYRDEVYNPETHEGGVCEVDFKKNRHGGTGVIKVTWLAAVMQFRNLAKMRY